MNIKSDCRLRRIAQAGMIELLEPRRSEADPA